MAITLASNFDETAAVPLDSRYTRADTTARDAIATGIRFQGLQVFTLADQKLWILKTGLTNSDWVEAGSGGGSGAWGGITGTLTDQTDLTSELTLKAPLASPTFTGTPAAPTAAVGTNTTQLATTAFVIANAPAGGINWITPSDGISATGYNVYADAAGVSPLDGTGGTATVTFAASATTPLRGTSSYLFTKPASNVQGQGWSKDFVIDSGFINSPVMHTISMLSKVLSGTFVTGDMTFWIVDTTSGQVIQPSAYVLQNATGAQVLRMEFQPNFNSANYRLVAHVSTVSALAYSLQFDDVSVSPNLSNAAAGSGTSVAGSWKTLTTTTAGAGTNLQFTTKMYDTNGAYSGGVITIPVSGKYAFNLAGGYGSGAFDIQFKVNGTSVFVPGTLFSTTRSAIGFQYDLVAGQTVSFASAIASTFGDTSVALQWALIAPPAASGSTGSVVSFSGTQTSQAVTANVTDIAFTATKDSNGAWTGSTYVVPIAGDYDIAGSFSSSANTSAMAYVDGVRAFYGSTVVGGGVTNWSGTLTNLKAGQIISVRAASTTTVSVGYCSIFRISGPAQVAASEKIYAKYVSSGGTAAAPAGPPAQYNTKVTDSHGAVTTGASWRFTAPRADNYRVSVGGHVTSSGAYGFNLYKNGASVEQVMSITNSTATSAYDEIYLNAGEYIDFRPSSSATIQASAYITISAGG